MAGGLGGRSFSLEQAAAQAGARVRTNTFARHGSGRGQRASKVVADSLTLWHGAQLAIDTTLVSPLHRYGTDTRTAADRNKAALRQARRTKETTYPELSREGGRARLMKLAAGVGERSSRGQIGRNTQ